MKFPDIEIDTVFKFRNSDIEWIKIGPRHVRKIPAESNGLFWVTDYDMDQELVILSSATNKDIILKEKD